METLFNQEWLSGNMGTIQWFANILGSLATVIISIVGLCIVIFSILKNASAGLYVSNRKLWDRVDEIKRSQIAFGSAWSSGGKDDKWLESNAITKYVGSISSFVLALLPNVKAMTDFAGDGEGDAFVQDPKHYFMKSLPAMCLLIFIGVFIWFGYPMQVANKFSEGGTYLIDKVLQNTDPQAWIDKVSGELVFYKYAHSNGKTPQDKFIVKVSGECMSALFGRLTDVKGEVRQTVAYDVESKITEIVDKQLSDYTINDDAWTYTVSAMVVSSIPPDSTFGQVKTSTNVVTYSQNWQTTVFNTGSTINNNLDAPLYLRLDITFNRKAASTSLLKGQINSAVMTLPSTGWSNVGSGIYTRQEGKYLDTKCFQAQNTSNIQGDGFEIVFESNGQVRITITDTAKCPLSFDSTTNNISCTTGGVQLSPKGYGRYKGANDSAYSTITKINFGSSADITYSDGGSITWNPGDDVKTVIEKANVAGSN